MVLTWFSKAAKEVEKLDMACDECCDKAVRWSCDSDMGLSRSVSLRTEPQRMTLR